MTQVGTDWFAIDRADDVDLFCNFMSRDDERNKFIALKFARPDSGYDRYDFDSPWCFEFQIDYETSGGGLFHWSPSRKKYLIKRDKKRAEILDFDWRRKTLPHKYR